MNIKSKPKVFIDGIYGTTGLEIDNALIHHSGVEILRIPESQKKDHTLRNKYAADADAVILCLQDNEAVSAVQNYKKYDHLKIIDTSTAHRTNPNWTYGLAELSGEHRNKIKNAAFIANCGCYPIGVCLAMRPLVTNRLISENECVVATGISGYSGGGSKLIKTYTGFSEHNETAKNIFRSYSLGKVHKHVPEMRLHSEFAGRIHFTPSVAFIHRGMMIQLHLNKSGGEAEKIRKVLHEQYAEAQFIRFHGLNNKEFAADGFLGITSNNGTNNVDIACFHAEHQLTIMCVYDNLGKGASLNVIQNLNLAFGFEESEGIPKIPLNAK